MTLSDTQLIILSAASQRTDHAVILPANLKGSAAKKVIDKLLKQNLLQELRAKDDMPVWRRGDDNRPYTLRITKGGLKAIEVGSGDGAPDDNATARPDDVVAAAVTAETNSKERPRRARRSSAKKAAVPSVRANKASFGRPKSELQAGPGCRPASTAKRSNPGYAGQGNRMAETLGARLLGGHGAQEAETSTAFRKDRRRPDLSHRSIQNRESCEKTTVGLIRCPGGNVMRPLWRPRLRVCPISAMTNCGRAGSCCSVVRRQNH